MIRANGHARSAPWARRAAQGEARDGTRRRLASRAALPIALVSTIVVVSLSADGVMAETIQPIAFADATTLTVGTDPSRVELVNNTADPWTLSVSGSLDLVNDAVATRRLVTSAPPIIPGGESIVIVVEPPPADVTKGSGFLVVTASRTGAQVVARRALAITAAAAAKPRIDKWTGSNQHATLPTVPLEGAGCGSLGVDSKNAYVTSGADTAPIPYTCHPAPTRLHRGRDALVRHGQGHKGRPIHGDDEDRGDLALTDVLAIGAPLARVPRDPRRSCAGCLEAGGHHRGAAGPRVAKDRVKQIGTEATDLQRAFRTAAGEELYGAYNLVPAVEAEVTCLVDKLQELQPGWLSKVGEGRVRRNRCCRSRSDGSRRFRERTLMRSTSWSRRRRT